MHDDSTHANRMIPRPPVTRERDRRGRTTLPADLLQQSAKRLQILALLYAFVFLTSNFLGYLIEPGEFSPENLRSWVPGVTSIAVALLVALVVRNHSIAPKTVMTVGLVFEVVGSVGIAVAQYWGVYRGLEHQTAHLEIFGLSWVAVWVMAFTIVVPNPPRRALVAAIASVSAVPVVLQLSIKYGGTSISLTPAQYLVGLIVPYALVVLMAYVGARVVYQLGIDVTRSRELGSYRLIERLGQGGMGEVWRAKHRMLARMAAIKLIRLESLGAAGAEEQGVALKRFEREVQATASLRSPHTIEVYDYGVSSGGRFYYVMELLDGFDLETLVGRFGAVPPERAIYLLRQACHSLAEAHDLGLIHRDIKPANLYACRYGREVDFLKVLDFGLVKPRREEARPDLKLTAKNLLGGTPAYMAPEQVLGDRPIDARTDIYTLGCVAYWILTGRMVFEGETPMRMMLMHAQDRPTRPSERAEQRIPTSLENVIMSCLEKDPERRPQSADDLSDLLGKCETDRAWTQARARGWWDENRPRTQRAVQDEPGLPEQGGMLGRVTKVEGTPRGPSSGAPARIDSAPRTRSSGWPPSTSS